MPSILVLGVAMFGTVYLLLMGASKLPGYGMFLIACLLLGMWAGFQKE